MREVRHVDCWLSLLSLCVLGLVSGCGASGGDDDAVAAVGTPNGTPNGMPIGMNSAGAAGGPASTGTGTAVSQLPCNVAGVVSNRCSLCHGAKLQAPMPLLTLADFHAPSKSDKTRKIYEVMPARINAQVPAMRMPPVSQGAVPAADLQALNTWLTAGALGVADGCAITTVGMETMGAAGVGGGEGTIVNTSGRSGGATDHPIEYNDPDMTCYLFTAHAPGDKMAPYEVSTTPDIYTNFTFAAPWPGKQYIRSLEVHSDNLDVIHHWLFFKNDAAGTDGDIADSTGAHPDGQLVHGWAPGGSNLYLDPDVGIEVPGDVSYTLETHHNNTTGAPAPDASGLKMCVTPKVPEHEASLSWLGTDNINGMTATGTCTPTGSEQIHILGATPHMHTKGTHMKVTIARAGGMEESFHDGDFDFGDQHSYPLMTIIMPGDSLTTTCTYNAPATFGRNTSDEMCYFFTLYYPKLSLTNGDAINNTIHGPNTCLGPLF